MPGQNGEFNKNASILLPKFRFILKLLPQKTKKIHFNPARLDKMWNI